VAIEDGKLRSSRGLQLLERDEMESNTYAGTLTAAAEKLTTAELEHENSRLQKLVADLLVKNQQLRLELKLVQRATGY
jgi:hypothetical protein